MLQGLTSLEYLDLSGNHLENVSSSTFIHLPRLRILRLQSNGLASSNIMKLRGLLHLEKLDLSSNALMGPLNFSSFPRLPYLMELNLAHNQISSVAREALNGLESLTSLSLKYNMIDVLEDNAFRGLFMLTSLDLAHNRMVAVSESSLAHLTKLECLDVSHNFLRALTADFISPLTSLKELRLDENDISIITKDALESATKLESLTLAENPLNCDCNLSRFAEWLRNSTLDRRDKNTAICATPPSLENGLVEQVPPDELVCGSQDELPVNTGQHPMPVSGSRVILQGYNYDGKMMYLLWNIQTIGFYQCQSLYVYEELGAHEVLLEHNDLHCNSTSLADPHRLPISWQTHHLQKGHRYRYCVVMVEEEDVESALILGCSEVITLVEHIAPQITSLKANITSSLTLTIQAQVWPHNTPCSITFHISVVSKFFKQTKRNCSSPIVIIPGLPTIGPYKICALLSDLAPYCIWIHSNHVGNVDKGNVNSLLLFLTILILVVMLLAYTLFHWLKNILKRSKIHEQCFLPTPQDQQQHSRYVKLQATTKV
ncbi:leucine-rich repeats and immunoglobulin-like domains protein 2 [Halyomorpha halys]|uniref:leucine-rich repeats and immunoglobulin-like domains protein 2 n=1 Tax=Halyomorpha halys TaxID=286706 RepID=UPI0006D52693|nr:leucine-rich repeat-containing protein 4B-like [Halyomorpha halys]